ncbi:MAG: hypothetical protein MZU97_04335 [Bacillus subtilis]|nr:hypothetical protein [Bacillus subtilis]
MIRQRVRAWAKAVFSIRHLRVPGQRIRHRNECMDILSFGWLRLQPTMKQQPI